MAKSVLIHEAELGKICDIVEIGKEYEVHSAFQWVSCDNNEVTHNWKWDLDSNGQFVFSKFSLYDTNEFKEIGLQLARSIAYKSTEEQLAMIYDELMKTGTISRTGPWASHVTNVKSTLPKGDLQNVINWHKEQNGVA